MPLYRMFRYRSYRRWRSLELLLQQLRPDFGLQARKPLSQSGKRLLHVDLRAGFLRLVHDFRQRYPVRRQDRRVLVDDDRVDPQVARNRACMLAPSATEDGETVVARVVAPAFREMSTSRQKSWQLLIMRGQSPKKIWTLYDGRSTGIWSRCCLSVCSCRGGTKWCMAPSIQIVTISNNI